MESLRTLVQRRLLTRTQSGPLSIEESLALRNEQQKRQHFQDCQRCNGESKVAGWPCIDDGEYRAKVRRYGYGLPWQAKKTFSSFRTDHGSKAAFNLCRSWARAPAGWLTLSGEPGTGKTHLALAVMEHLLESKQPGRFYQVSDLLDWWRSLYDMGMDPKGNWETWELAIVLDDLGAERPTEWAIEKLGQFLDWRVRNELPTLITTNLGKEDLGARLHPRIADRVYDTGSGLVKVSRLTNASYRTGR